MQFKLSVALLGISALITLVFGPMIVNPSQGLQLSNLEPNISANSRPQESTDNGIVYPTSTYLCDGGCKPHSNWIQFYLPPGNFSRRSLQLKTSLFMGQILTYGISGSRCYFQDKPGYSCIDMELSHRLLQVLTEFNLIPIDQLRDTNNWWLEYMPSSR